LSYYFICLITFYFILTQSWISKLQQTCSDVIAILKDIGGEYTEEGNITEWEKYRDIYLWPVTTRFAVSQSF